MGMFDAFGRRSVQLKNGECVLHCYNVGDEVYDGYPDGIYVGVEGIIVIYGRKVVAELPVDCVRDKWGGVIDVALKVYL